MADDWVWSDWITPALVTAKANIGSANAGASARIPGSSDSNAAMDAVRTGGATGSSSLTDGTGAPYSYIASAEMNGDSFFDAGSAQAYDSTQVLLTDPPTAYAAFNVGYSSGYWRERPDLRQLPDEFRALSSDEYVKIKPGYDWDSFVEFEPGVNTVAVEWADIWVSITGSGNEVGGNIGYSPGILLPPTAPGTGWSGSFASWPPPLGAQVLHWAGPDAPATQVLSVKPPAGSDFTLTSYTDLALGGYPPNHEWQQWIVRPWGGPAGTGIYIWHQMPRFRYRIPVTAKPRFFVKDLDGVMCPVGFGKPATETAVYRVPTAVGMYRDLTTAEYATYGPDARPPGGYPLKVKRRDTDGADWWDHVGWMIPAE